MDKVVICFFAAASLLVSVRGQMFKGKSSLTILMCHDHDHVCSSCQSSMNTSVLFFAFQKKKSRRREAYSTLAVSSVVTKTRPDDTVNLACFV